MDVSSLIDPIDLQDTLNFEESSFLTDLGNIDFSALDYAQLTTEVSFWISSILSVFFRKLKKN